VLGSDWRLPAAHRGGVPACAFTATGDRLYSVATGSDGENELKGWRVAGDGALEEVLRVPLGSSYSHSLAVSPGGLVAVGTREGAVLLLEGSWLPR